MITITVMMMLTITITIMITITVMIMLTITIMITITIRQQKIKRMINLKMIFIAVKFIYVDNIKLARNGQQTAIYDFKSSPF